MERSDAGHPSVVGVSAQREPVEEHDVAALFRAHADFVWRAVQRLGIGQAHAEDAVQEVFIIAQRRLPEFRGDGAITTWLFGIARGVCANARRAGERAERRLAVIPPPPEAVDPEQAVARRDAATIVERFLLSLPAAQRDVFELIDIEGMSGPDVAALLGAPLGSVYSRLRLARTRFEAFVDAHSQEAS